MGVGGWSEWIVRWETVRDSVKTGSRRRRMEWTPAVGRCLTQARAAGSIRQPALVWRWSDARPLLVLDVEGVRGHGLARNVVERAAGSELIPARLGKAYAIEARDSVGA